MAWTGRRRRYMPSAAVRPQQAFVGEPTQSCFGFFDFAGSLAESRCPLFGDPAWRESDMTPEERQMLGGLFQRVNSAAAAPRDGEAEAFINDAVRAAPHAPYVLAQT